MRVLVTGANGYIGMRLLASLAEGGHEVLAVVRNVARIDGRTRGLFGAVAVGEGEFVRPGEGGGVIEKGGDRVEAGTDGKAAAEADGADGLDGGGFEGARLRIVEHDFLQQKEGETLGFEVDVAYYLIHSMGSGEEFLEREERCARNFVQWMDGSGVGQVVYLSGIVPVGGVLSEGAAVHDEEDESEGRDLADEVVGPVQKGSGVALGSGRAADVEGLGADGQVSHDGEEGLSEHLASRLRVERVLHGSGVPTTVLRASIIVGSGSASFEMIRDLVEKLPVMITPKWTRTPCQPIAIRDVMGYLTGVMGEERALGRSFDIGGPEVLTYGEMLTRFAEVRGLKRMIFPVPLFSPGLSSYWLTLITSTNYQLAKALVGSLHVPTFCRESEIDDFVEVEKVDYKTAIERAFVVIAQNRVPSTWFGALSKGGLSPQQVMNVQVPEHGILQDRREVELGVSRQQAIESVWSLGGKKGWPSMDWAWDLRGLMDELVGGSGVRRGRRNAQGELASGDALDFWRVVVADRQQGRLLLVAEMKLPGVAWLEFVVEQESLVQRAVFRPKGLLGRLYWYATWPFHLWLFPRMARKLANGW